MVLALRETNQCSEAEPPIRWTTDFQQGNQDNPMGERTGHSKNDARTTGYPYAKE